MWGTNFPQWIRGNMDFHFTVFGYADRCISRVYRRALQLGQGARILSASLCCAGLTLPDGVQVSSLLPNDGGWVLHLRDTALCSRSAVLAAEGWTITPIDLRGSATGAPCSGRITFSMQPYAVRAFRLSK